MADAMGRDRRAYQDAEKSEPYPPFGRRHQAPAESASLRIAVDQADPMLTTAEMRGLALDLAVLIRAGAAGRPT